MPTLILTPRFTDGSQALWRAAGRLGWGVERLPSYRVPDDLKAVPEPVLYVEALFAPTVAEEFGLRLDEPADDWLPRLPVEYRKREVRLSTLGEARRLPAPAFVKPPNDKSFAARVYAGHELPPGEDGQPALVAEVVAWEKEFRCFVLNRRIVTFSIYLRGGELQREHGFRHTEAEETELMEFLGRLLADERALLGRTAVLDVGVIVGRGWAVVEQNSAWGAGLYGCSPERVLEVLRHAAVPLPR